LAETDSTTTGVVEIDEPFINFAKEHVVKLVRLPMGAVRPLLTPPPPPPPPTDHGHCPCGSDRFCGSGGWWG
jgi:hypothetical protein